MVKFEPRRDTSWLAGINGSVLWSVVRLLNGDYPDKELTVGRGIKIVD